MIQAPNRVVLELDHLTKRYGVHRGVEDLSLSVREGEIYGFIGPNGAGKTTTIRTLLGLIKPTSGEARLFGLDCVSADPKVRKDVGYLPGEVFFYEDMRVGELLHYAAGFYPGDHRARTKELAAYMELDLDRKIGELSFGNKKKVGIVQGLLHEPRLLLLDEPTAGLDPLMQQRFFDLIRAENAKGVTVFFSSHILSEVQRLCHRVAILKEGRLVEEQSMERLRAQSCCRVRLSAEDMQAEKLQLAGISDLTVGSGEARFLYRGEPGALLRALEGLRLSSLWIEEPSLEEIFLHYYEGGA